MNKGQGHRRLHGCIASTALKGICYLTKQELSGLNNIIKTKYFALKTVPNSSQSNVTYRSRSHNCVMQLLQSYGCKYIPRSKMIATAIIVCKIHHLLTLVNLSQTLLMLTLTHTLTHLLTHSQTMTPGV